MELSPELVSTAMLALPYLGRAVLQLGPKSRRSKNNSWICRHFPYLNPGLCYT